jgi:hypothetical protein
VETRGRWPKLNNDRFSVFIPLSVLLKFQIKEYAIAATCKTLGGENCFIEVKVAKAARKNT